MKKLFKKQSAMDTLTNVGIGGAANVAIDYVVSQIPQVAAEPTYVNIGKIALGAIGGAMTSNKFLRAAVDGVAVVGVSNLISDLISGEEQAGGESKPASGLAKGTIGRMVPGNLRYRRNKISGIGAAANAFIGK